MFKKQEFLKSISILTFCGLTACTGGSSGGSGGADAPTANNTPVPPTVAEYDTLEFQQNSALEQMNVQVAYINGYTGAGVLVAVIDSGITEVRELAGQLHSSSTNIVTNDADDLDDYIGHGTAIGGLIAAVRDNDSNNSSNNMHGVAYGAKLLNINATSANNCPDLENCSFFHSDIANAYGYARLNGANIINESLGSDTQGSINLQQAMKAAVDADILIVVPAGNINDDTPAGAEDSVQLSASVAYADWANGQIIVAGSVDANNVISDFSYRSGEDAKNVYLVAPGGSITAPSHSSLNSNSYVTTTGTSASTALISGAAALLMEAFPNLSAAQTADLLFTTATDLGVVGPDPIYGRGLVNLEEAFTAQGQFTIAGNGFAALTEIGTPETASTQNLILSGGAFGADISFASSLNDIMVQDSYGRSFNVDLSNGIYLPSATISLSAFTDGALTSKYHSMAISENTSVRMGWRHDDRYAEMDRLHFSNHLDSDKKAGDLRMAITHQLNDNQTVKMSAGMSLTELMEDYRPDDYIAPNKHGFSTLFKPNSTTALSYASSISANTTYETTIANSKRNIAEEFIGRKLNVKNTLMLNRINHYVSDALTLAFDIGLMQEKGSVLGAVSTGALEIGSGANTGFIGGKMDWKISDRSLFFARASYGVTEVFKSNTSILGNISTLKSFSYLLGVKSSGLMRDDDQLSFTVSQPLKLVGGTATISNATSRNYQTDSYTMNYSNINLGPSGTERNVELAYKIGNFFGSSIGINLLHQFNPGHVKSIKSATSALLRIRSSF